MAPPSPARLFATVAGALLFVLGIAGFFDDLSWLNFLYVGTGALGLLLAGATPRPYALAVGVAYTALAIFGSDGDGWLHLAVGLLGLAAAAAPSSEPRTQPAGKGL
ncbi:MAG TPA: hypothetical protein VFR04_07245 [Solirubrobacterales bacterium]|nr:hypothetical protein [Solirubrobacterales bacterium]